MSLFYLFILLYIGYVLFYFFFFQAEDGIRDADVTGVQTCALPIFRQRLNVEKSAGQLRNFFEASVELMQVMARACGHDSLSSFSSNDLATWHRDMALLSGVKYSGFIEP